MYVEFNQDTCIGMYNCVEEWDKFVEDRDAGKASLVGGEKTDSNVYVREVPSNEEFDAKMAARVCPVDAIAVYEDDDQIIP